AQRGFSAAELLPAFAVVLAGRDQGSLSRTREYRRQLRSRGAQPVFRDEAAERGFAQDLRETVAPPGLHPVQRLPARPLLVPILRRARRPHLRSPAAALAWRPHDLGQRRCGLLAVQSAQRQPHAERSEDVAIANAVPTDGAPPAPQRSALPAKLSARKLARLSLLGHRARALSFAPNWSVSW